MRSATAPGIKIVASQTANWERDQGFNVFQNMLQAHPDIDTLFACNDLMALGAIEAIRRRGQDRQDTRPGLRRRRGCAEARLTRGRMEATVAQFPDEMGRIAVETAVKASRASR